LGMPMSVMPNPKLKKNWAIVWASEGPAPGHRLHPRVPSREPAAFRAIRAHPQHVCLPRQARMQLGKAKALPRALIGGSLDTTTYY
jgi:hypothetical protein